MRTIPFGVKGQSQKREDYDYDHFQLKQIPRRLIVIPIYRRPKERSVLNQCAVITERKLHTESNFPNSFLLGLNKQKGSSFSRKLATKYARRRIENGSNSRWVGKIRKPEKGMRERETNQGGPGVKLIPQRDR